MRNLGMNVRQLRGLIVDALHRSGARLPTQSRWPPVESYTMRGVSSASREEFKNSDYCLENKSYFCTPSAATPHFSPHDPWNFLKFGGAARQLCSQTSIGRQTRISRKPPPRGSPAGQRADGPTHCRALTYITKPFATTYQPLMTVRLPVAAIMAMNSPDAPLADITLLTRLKGQPTLVTLEVVYGAFGN